MLGGVVGGRPQDVVQVVTQGERSLDTFVDVALVQEAGMRVVRTEHDLLGVFFQQRMEHLEIPGGAAFTDQDTHTQGAFLPSLFQGDGLMVGRDACGDVGF